MTELTHLHTHFTMLICSHIGLTVHTGADGDVCVCERETQLVVGAQLLLSVNTLHLHAIYKLDCVLLFIPQVYMQRNAFCFVLFCVTKLVLMSTV